MNKLFVSLSSMFLFAFPISAQALKLVEKDSQGTHIKVPFVHVDVGGTTDSDKHVHVKAPFVKVDNPPGDNNASVKAPLTKVDNNRLNTQTTQKSQIKTDLSSKQLDLN